MKVRIRRPVTRFAVANWAPVARTPRVDRWTPMKCFALSLLLASCAVAGASDSRPVLVGGNEDLDACLGSGTLAGAKSGLVSVRAGPGQDYPEVDRLGNGAWVALCDDSGEWSGVVYSTDEHESCGVGTPIRERAPYRGRCKSGWIRSRWITDIAG